MPHPSLRSALVPLQTHDPLGFLCSLDNLKNAASVDAKLSGVLEEKDLKIAEMEQRYCSSPNF